MLQRIFTIAAPALFIVLSIGNPSAWSMVEPKIHALARTGTPPELQGVGIQETELGKMISINRWQFQNELGQQIQLSKYFHTGKPVIVVLAYYECPNLCTFVLNGLFEGLKTLEWKPGEQFEVVVVSIEPKETAELAGRKKAAYLNLLGKQEAASGIHFLVSKENQVENLAKELGFAYRYDVQEKEFAHGSGIFVLTPEGKISRILFGIQYTARELKLALTEASMGKIGTIVDRILLFCYRYDPKTKKYLVYSFRLVQAGGALTLLVLGAYLVSFWRKQRSHGVKTS